MICLNPQTLLDRCVHAVCAHLNAYAPEQTSRLPQEIQQRIYDMMQQVEDQSRLLHKLPQAHSLMIKDKMPQIADHGQITQLFFDAICIKDALPLLAASAHLRQVHLQNVTVDSLEVPQTFQCTRIQALHLSNVHIYNNKTWKAFLQAVPCKNLQALTIKSFENITPHEAETALTLLQKSKELRSFSFQHYDSVDSNGFFGSLLQEIPLLPHLQALHISFFDAAQRNETLRQLTAGNKLVKLVHYEGAPYDAEGPFCCNISSLQILGEFVPQKYCQQKIEQFAQLPALTCLKLLLESPIIATKDLQMLSRITTLQALSFDFLYSPPNSILVKNLIDSSLLSQLSHLALYDINMNVNSQKTLFKAINEIAPQLRSLKLTAYLTEPSSITFLGRALQTHTALQRLRLPHISYDGLSHLIESMCKNKTVRFITLRYNQTAESLMAMKKIMHAYPNIALTCIKDAKTSVQIERHARFSWL